MELDDGVSKEVFHLERLNSGLYVMPMTWIKITHFSRDVVLQVYPSENYDVCEYIDKYSEFMERKGLLK